MNSKFCFNLKFYAKEFKKKFEWRNFFHKKICKIQLSNFHKPHGFDNFDNFISKTIWIWNLKYLIKISQDLKLYVVLIKALFHD